MMKQTYTYADLLQIVADLRGEGGCPWDRVQTHESMKTCLVEECYEVIEAINLSDDENLKEELGDVLLQVLMHSQIAAEEQRFTVADVIQELSEKLIRRHPHVFGTGKAGTPDEGLQNWEAIKQQEKAGRETGSEKNILRTVPKAFPALIRAQKVQKKARKEYGYERAMKDSCDSLRAILDQIEDTGFSQENEHLAARIEAFLFETAGFAGNLGINAENSLTNATETFINKFEEEMDKQEKPV